MARLDPQRLRAHHNRVVTRFRLASPLRKLAAVILAGLVLGSFGYSVSTYQQMCSWIA